MLHVCLPNGRLVLRQRLRIRRNLPHMPIVHPLLLLLLQLQVRMQLLLHIQTLTPPPHFLPPVLILFVLLDLLLRLRHLTPIP